MQQLTEILEKRTLYTGRLISSISHSIGLPISVVRPQEYPSLGDYTIDTDASSTEASLNLSFIRYGSPQIGFLDDATKIYKSKSFDLIPSGRHNEHLFTTLLRTETPWFRWEIAYVKSLLENGAITGTPKRFNYPDVFRETLHFYAEWNASLTAIIVYGPVPIVGSGAALTIDQDIKMFCDAIMYIRDVWHTHARESSIDDHHYRILAASYPSHDRLRRFFYSGGQYSSSFLTDLVGVASAAIRCCLETKFNFDLFNPNLEMHRSHIVEFLGVLSSFFQEEGTRTARSFHIKCEGIGSLQVSFPKGNEAAAVCDLHLSGSDAIQTKRKVFAELKSHGHIDIVNKPFRKYYMRYDENNTKSIMSQFILARHWLNDRYARLSPLYEKSIQSRSEFTANLRDISRWILDLFDADFVALYEFIPGGSLSELAKFARNEDLAIRISEENSERMQSLAELKNAPLRCESMAYRAFWRQQPVHIQNWNGSVNDIGMTSGRNMGENRPRSALAAPIVIFGRSWGVIEVMGFCPNQFAKISSLWLEEAAQLIGHPLYQTSILKAITAANMSVLSDVPNNEESEASNQEKHDYFLEHKSYRYFKILSAICHHMSEMFMADGAAIWVEKETWPGVFVLKGLSNIDCTFTEELIYNNIFSGADWPQVSINDTDSLVSRAMRFETASQWDVISEDLSAPPVEEETARSKYQACLWQSGVRNITIIPLYEPRGDGKYSPIGVLSLYSKTYISDEAPRRYGPKWIPMIEFAGRHIAMLVRTLALESERQNSLELMFSHEVIGSIRDIQDQYGYIYNNLLVHVGSEEASRTEASSTMLELQAPLRISTRDIRKVANRIKNKLGESAETLAEMRRKGFRIPALEVYEFKSRAKWDGKAAVLFNIIQESLNSRYLLKSNQKLVTKIQTRISGNDDFIRVRIPPNDLRTIFNNLAINALKYAKHNTIVSVEIKRTASDTLYVSFSNEGVRLEAGEAARIFKLGFRGERAKRSQMEGSGNGLFIAKRLAQSLSIDITYHSRPINAEEDIHTFSVIFNRGVVIYGRNGK